MNQHLFDFLEDIHDLLEDFERKYKNGDKIKSRDQWIELFKKELFRERGISLDYVSRIHEAS